MSILQILVAARWIHFTAIFALFGCPVACLLLRGSAETARVLGAAGYLLRVAAVVAALSGLAWIAALITNMAGGFADAATPDTLNAFFFETQFGSVVIVRLILLALAVLVIALPRGIRLGAWFVVGAGLLIDQAWLGHAANGGASLYGALMIAVYSIHVLAGAAWVGGLPVLLFALFARRCAADNVAILSRYSILAASAVTLILLSGLANALFRVHGHIAQLVATGYGEILLVKLILVALMLGLAGYNRFIALPGLGATKEMPSRLVLSIGVELTLGLLVIGVAALLGITPPPD